MLEGVQSLSLGPRRRLKIWTTVSGMLFGMAEEVIDTQRCTRVNIFLDSWV